MRKVIMHGNNSWHRWTMGILLAALVLHGCRPVESTEATATKAPASESEPDSPPPAGVEPSQPETKTQVEEAPAPPGPVAPVEDPGPAVPNPPMEQPAALGPNVPAQADPDNARPPSNSPETIEIIRSLPAWEPEPNQLFASQRPVALFVFDEDYGPNNPLAATAAKCALDLAERLAHCGYDVKLLVGLPEGADPELHWTVGNVCRRIREINLTIEKRNIDDDIPAALRAKIAPLKLLAKPEIFSDGPSLMEAIEIWLGQTHNVEFVGPDIRVAEEGMQGRRGRIPVKERKKRSKNDRRAGAVANVPPNLDVRPPFAAMYFRGHGAVHNQTDVFYTPGDIRLEQLALEELVQIQRIAKIAAKKFHVPLWICTDMCRTDQPLRVKPAANLGQKAAAGEPIGPRELNLEGVPKKYRPFVREIEDLRQKATPGAGLFVEEHENDATILLPDIMGREILDREKYSLGHYLAEALHISDAPRRAGLQFSKFNSKSLTLMQLYRDSQGELVQQADGDMMPIIKIGPIRSHQVVASTVRGFKYPRIRMDLLAGNIEVDRGLTGFAVSEDNGEMGVEVLREQGTFNDDFRAFFNFENAFRLDPARKWKLVLHVSGRVNGNRMTEIKFVVGAYYGYGDLLTTRFKDFPSADSVMNPVPCDGKAYFRETPLDLDADVPRELKHLEVQSCPTGPEASWPLGASLTLLGAYVVPMEYGIDQLKAEIEAQRRVLGDQNVIGQWWCTTSLDPNPGGMGVSASLHSDNNREIGIILNNTVAKSPMWGVTGGFYPRRHVERGKSRLRLRISSSEDADKQAEVGVCVYSGNRILAAHKVSYSDAKKGTRIPILESGVVDELAVAVEGLSKLRIEELSFSNAGDR